MHGPQVKNWENLNKKLKLKLNSSLNLQSSLKIEKNFSEDEVKGKC